MRTIFPMTRQSWLVLIATLGLLGGVGCADTRKDGKEPSALEKKQFDEEMMKAAERNKKR